MKLFNTDIDAQVFRDRDTLQDDYVPEELAGNTRDDELQQLAAALQPIIHGNAPDNVILRGPNGSGKTAAVRIVLNVLGHEINQLDQREFSYLIVNGSQHNTGYQLARELANKLHNDTEFKQGHSYSALLDAVAQGVENLNGAVVVAIDELRDGIEDIDQLLYLLSRTSSNDALTDKKIGLIATTTDASFKNMLSPNVKSTLGKRTIKFAAYDTDDLRKILDSRVKDAFAEEAVEESALALCAALASQQGGDARFALDLVKYAGDIASQNGANHVTEEEIDKARKLWEKEHVDSIVANLALKQRQVLYSLVDLADVDNISKPRTAKIISCYNNVAKRSKSVEVVSNRTVSRYLQTFVDEGLLRTELHHHHEGSWRDYELVFDEEYILEALRDDIERGKIAVSDDLSW
ncbi:AAA family ATPase [Haladaptatus sp. DYF46]|uniref:Cdc6/Cdc18 family protein n=1 Tax=Haladaptatus sp. DYF46 TaxID=2886041 RepID=UPI001E3CECA8|nr:AAA family ATPase [Haladaptatus sp. DYF46]